MEKENIISFIGIMAIFLVVVGVMIANSDKMIKADCLEYKDNEKFEGVEYTQETRNMCEEVGVILTK
jgi:hypothetical protein